MNTPWTALLNNIPAQPVDLSRTTALIPLPSLAAISLRGPESMKFLQGQATTDFREVQKGRVLRGAICSLKGRVLFSFIAVPDGENFSLVLPADQLEAALAHLKKYAIFSKTVLGDTRESIAVASIAGPEAETQVAALVGEAPDAERAIRTADGAMAMRIGTEPRYLLLLPVQNLTAVVTSQPLPIATENQWWAADIRAGLATIFAASRDLFQPQELNFHAIEAVSYNKGCYTGQEVVARLYFRGKLKQRLYHLGTATHTAIAASGIFSEGKQVGDIVMTTTENGQQEILAIVKNTAAREGQLTLGENGPELSVQVLPYPLPEDKEE